MIDFTEESGALTFAVLSGRASKSKRVRVRGAKASDLLRLAEEKKL